MAEKGFSGNIMTIIVIIYAIIATIIAYYNWPEYRGIETRIEPSFFSKETDYAFILEIRGLYVNLNNKSINFQIFDEYQSLQLDIYFNLDNIISNQSCLKLIKNWSIVYAFSYRSRPIISNITGENITPDTDLRSYQNCSLAFIDMTSNNIIDSGDFIYIYKDPNGDGLLDVDDYYTFEILYESKLIGKKVL